MTLNCVHLYTLWGDLTRYDFLQVHLSSQHAHLKRLNIVRLDRVAVIHFEYSTGDACGQNMVTSVTSFLCKWIISKVSAEIPTIKILNYCIESGMSGDKSITFANLLKTRGFHVQAEAWISEDILKSVLKVWSFESYQCDCLYVLILCR